MVGSRRSLLVALIVAGAFFMEQLDGTVISTALPQMAHSFGDDPVRLSIGMTAYLLTLAVFIPISGWVADRYGTRSVFGGAIVVFTLASVLCGLSANLWEFVAARVFQGIGGAMMVPVGRLIVLRTTEKRDLLRSMTFITWPGLVAPVLGPPVGGFITTYLSWRWIFLLNVPIGIAGIVLVLLFIANQRAEEKRPLDGVGFVLSALALASLVYVLDLVGRAQVDWRLVAVLAALGIVSGTLAIRHAKRHPRPLLDLSTLAIPTFAAAAIWGGSISRTAINAVPFLLPLLFQVGLGMSAFTSGMLLLAFAAGNLSMKSITTAILRRWGFRNVLIVNGGLCAATMFACAALSARTPVVLIVLILLASGLTRSMQFTALTSLAFVDVPQPAMSGASSFASMMQQLAWAMGIAVGALALKAAVVLHPGAGNVLRHTAVDFRIAFATIGVLMLVALPDFARLRGDAGAEVSGHRPGELAAAS
jgi:EmrB/QacA subfamily drug resistance transporter